MIFPSFFRYKLLLDELIRNTLDTHPDYATLTESLSLVSSVAKHVNAEMHASENRATILRIQSEFTHPVNFVAPHRKFVRQGPLVKKCRASDKTYEFFVFSDLLVYASTSLGQRFKLHQEIPIDRNFKISDVPWTPTGAADEKEVFMFQIENVIKSFIVIVPDLSEKTSWLQTFATVLSERDASDKSRTAATPAGGAASIASPSKDIVAPVWKNDSSEDACPCCQKKFTFTKRRHRQED